MSDEQTTNRQPSPHQSGAQRGPAPGETEALAIGDWLHIERDTTVLVWSGKAEVGQNIRTSLAQAVAEELCVPFRSVRVVLGDTALTPYDAGTFGSRTTGFMVPLLRKVAASAREVLIDLAAARWNVPRATLYARDGHVVHGATGRSISYGTLTDGQRLSQEYDDDAPLHSPEQWTVAGAAVPRLDARDIVTGKHRFSPDLTRPGMHVGVVLRPPCFGATLQALNSARARALPGVTVVHDEQIVGVVAPTRRRALEALAALDATWSKPAHPHVDDLATYLRDHPAPPDAERRPFELPLQAGSLEQGRALSAIVMEQTYTVAYIAHAPLEPRAAIAEWEGDRLTVWTGTQLPFGVRDELQATFELPVENVRVIVPDTGSAYGGKHTGEAALEAARLARAAGCAVKLIWTREEEFTWAYFRPGGVIDIRAGVQADGTLAFWDFQNHNSGMVGARTPYEVAHQHIAYQPSVPPLRQGSYRALAATANHWARESMMDELAHGLSMDPYEFRLHNLKDARIIAVLRAAAERFGWGTSTPPPNHGYGIACGTEKGSVLATCVEILVEPETRALRVVRVVQAFECGAIVNPDGLRNQIEGAIVQGLGGALFEAIEFADGKILNPRFSAYRVPRFADLPPIDLVLLDRKELPSVGAGETPIVGIAPAIGNAIRHATGIRLRSMPMTRHGIVELAEG
jgi:nicotinate dehydrogenase subunit B